MIDITELRTTTLDPVVADELDSFEDGVRRYLAGELDEDVFRVFRLNNGIYGQRQGGHNQMVRVKVPYGARRPPTSSRCSATSPTTYSPRLGPHHHPPEHPVPLRRSSSRSPEVLRDCSPSVGLTTPRGVRRHRAQRAGLPPRRRLPVRGARHHARGPRRRTEHFLRNPLAQRLPRKFKINFSGCATDCGQAMFNDVGVIAVDPPARRRHRRARLPGVRRRRPRRQPAPGAGARGVHVARGPAAHDRGDPARRSTTTATATTSCGPA